MDNYLLYVFSSMSFINVFLTEYDFSSKTIVFTSKKAIHLFNNISQDILTAAGTVKGKICAEPSVE